MMSLANPTIRGTRIVLVRGQQCRFRVVLPKGTQIAMKRRSKVQESGSRDTVLRRT